MVQAVGIRGRARMIDLAVNRPSIHLFGADTGSAVPPGRCR